MVWKNQRFCEIWAVSSPPQLRYLQTSAPPPYLGFLGFLAAPPLAGVPSLLAPPLPLLLTEEPEALLATSCTSPSAPPVTRAGSSKAGSSTPGSFTAASSLGRTAFLLTCTGEYLGAGVQECRSAGVQECRGAEVQEFRSSGAQRCRGAEVQRCRGAEVPAALQMCRPEAALRRSPEPAWSVPPLHWTRVSVHGTLNRRVRVSASGNVTHSHGCTRTLCECE